MICQWGRDRIATDFGEPERYGTEVVVPWTVQQDHVPRLIALRPKIPVWCWHGGCTGVVRGEDACCFAHPLTDDQRRQLCELLTTDAIEERRLPFQLDDERPFVAQTRDLVAQVGVDSDAWPPTPCGGLLPGVSVGCALVIADIAGRAE